MNRLERMVLVNSANVPYREISLDGHIHFIGTQGTGKSTLLRALLFFYNADSRKLGISKEKKAFADYYFPYADSYIFYEVRQGKRLFCVWLYKRLNRLCFRFIDGNYNPTLALDGNHARAERDVLARAEELGVKVERPIYNFTEYRDVIYGENRSMLRYALMRDASNYSTIPRTISNVFLNASLDGEYIKRTIIDSLSDESDEINLETNRHHLESARRDYVDVETYLRNEAKTERIVSLYAQVQELEKKQRDAAWKIGAAVNRARERSRVLSQRCEAKASELEVQERVLGKLKEDFETSKRRVQDRLATVKSDIARVGEKKRHYMSMNIETLLKEARREPDLKRQQSDRSEEMRVLTAAVEQREQLFETTVQRLENNSAERINQLKADHLEAREKGREKYDAARRESERKGEEIEFGFEEEAAPYRTDMEALKNALSETDFELRQLEREPFFEAERHDLDERRGELEQLKLRTEGKIVKAQSDIASLGSEDELKRKLAESESEAVLRPMREKREWLRDRLSELRSELDGLDGSFLEYLDENVDGWARTIGKVARREVLLNAKLEPRAGVGQSLYGVELSLDSLEVEPLSKKTLEESTAAAESELSELSKKQDARLNEDRLGMDRLAQNYKRKARELLVRKKELEAKGFEAQRDLERNALAVDELESRIESVRADRRRALEKRRLDDRRRRDELRVQMDALSQNRNDALSRLKSDLARRERVFRKEEREASDELERQSEEQRKLLAKQLARVAADRNAFLREQGIDAERLARLERRIDDIRKQLELIEGNRSTVFEYEKDKREWLDRLKEFQATRALEEKNLERLVERFEYRIRTERERRDDLVGEMKGLKEELETALSEIRRFEQFEKEELFSVFESSIRHHGSGDSIDCRDRINALTNLTFKQKDRIKLLIEQVTEFSGLFSEGNCLSLEVHLSDERSFRTFSENLTRFVKDQRIVLLKTEVTKKYSMVLDSIVSETKRLLRRKDEVHRVIQKVNDDFRKSNFVGVVRSIEVRALDGNNRVFQVLRLICDFQADNPFGFGELNLFNHGKQGNDERAVRLLERLKDELAQVKNKTLRLEDAIDLEFRVRENDNDTNWVSRLANVGSNGTDVLVKSMIYINLLNIFKSSKKRKEDPSQLHCLIDEVGILHDSNVASLINFAAERGICMINGSPNSHNEQDYKHIYIFRQEKNRTAIHKLVSHVA